jgi:hypothetical protein
MEAEARGMLEGETLRGTLVVRRAVKRLTVGHVVLSVGDDVGLADTRWR